MLGVLQPLCPSGLRGMTQDHLCIARMGSKPINGKIIAVPEWSKGDDLRSSVLSTHGFEPHLQYFFYNLRCK